MSSVAAGNITPRSSTPTVISAPHITPSPRPRPSAPPLPDHPTLAARPVRAGGGSVLTATLGPADFEGALPEAVGGGDPDA